MQIHSNTMATSTKTKLIITSTNPESLVHFFLIRAAGVAFFHESLEGSENFLYD